MGVGDALVSSLLSQLRRFRERLLTISYQASIIGKRVGRNRWSTTNGKTTEGSLAFFFSVFLAGIGLAATGAIPSFPVSPYKTESFYRSIDILLTTGYAIRYTLFGALSHGSVLRAKRQSRYPRLGLVFRGLSGTVKHGAAGRAVRIARSFVT